MVPTRCFAMKKLRCLLLRMLSEPIGPGRGSSRPAPSSSPAIRTRTSTTCVRRGTPTLLRRLGGQTLQDVICAQKCILVFDDFDPKFQLLCCLCVDSCIPRKSSIAGQGQLWRWARPLRTRRRARRSRSRRHLVRRLVWRALCRRRAASRWSGRRRQSTAGTV